MFGLNGGAEWPGGALDPKTGTVFIPTNKTPFILRINYVDKNPYKTKNLAAKNATYVNKCLSCHKDDLSGYVNELTDMYTPALVGITKKEAKICFYLIKNFYITTNTLKTIIRKILLSH